MIEWEVGMIARSGHQPDDFCGPVTDVSFTLHIANLFGQFRGSSVSINKELAIYVDVDELTDEQCAKLVAWRLTHG